MIFVHGSSLTNMEIGERKSFIVTNEIHNFDPFWKTAVFGMALLGFVAYYRGYKAGKEVAQESAGKFAKPMAIINALLALYDIYDDSMFTFVTQHDDKAILFL